jgi:eukaryotic-like serine/threonine-protein kinase
MFCGDCGTQLPDGTRFCVRCGANQESFRPDNTNPEMSYARAGTASGAAGAGPMLTPYAQVPPSSPPQSPWAPGSQGPQQAVPVGGAPPRVLGGWTQGLLWTLALLGTGLTLVAVGALSAFETWTEEGTDAALQDSYDADSVFTGLLGLLVVGMIAAGVLFIVWLWQSYRTARQQGAGGFRFGLGWTIGAWFVPFANFVLPKLMVNDLWRASDPDAPAGWPIAGRRVSPIVDWWWAFWLLGFVGLEVAASTGDGDLSEDAWRTLYWGSIIGSACLTTAAVLAALVVREVMQRQQRRASAASTPQHGPPLRNDTGR